MHWDRLSAPTAARPLIGSLELNVLQPKQNKHTRSVTSVRVSPRRSDVPIAGVPVSQPRSQATKHFDTFLCHNSDDKAAVQKIARQLLRNGVSVWLDEWHLRPGTLWQRSLEEEIPNIRSAVVFIGASGLGPWQRIEIEAFLREFVARGCPVVPAILPRAPFTPEMPVFLKGMTWVDFRKSRPKPLRQLIWGITGRLDD
jgi:hypothetical protein